MLLIIPIYLLSRNSLFHYLYMVGAICVIMVLMHYFKKGLIIPHFGKLMSCFGLHTLDIYLFHGFILTYIDFAFLDHRYISHNFLIQFLQQQFLRIPDSSSEEAETITTACLNLTASIISPTTPPPWTRPWAGTRATAARLWMNWK